MATKVGKDEIIDAIGGLTVLELADLVKALEEKFGVSAAAPVALAAVPGSPFPIGEGTAERLYSLAAYPAKSCPAAK